MQNKMRINCRSFDINKIIDSRREKASINSKCINLLTKAERRFIFVILEYNAKVIYNK